MAIIERHSCVLNYYIVACNYTFMINYYGFYRYIIQKIGFIHEKFMVSFYFFKQNTDFKSIILCENS